MAEALGIVASVIAVLQLTTSVTGYCYKYISTVITAPMGIEKMAAELSAINILLRAIKAEIIKSGGSPNTPSNQVAFTAEIEKILPGYEQELNELLLLFRERDSSVARRLQSRFSWPIKTADIEREIGRLRRYKDLFQFALTLDIAKMTRVIEIYSRNVDRSVKEILSTVEKEYTIQRQKEAREESDRHTLKSKDVFKWLFQGQWDIKHTDIQKRQHPGTGLWLLRHPQFKSWLDGTEGQILCGFGIPGAGKTVMSCIVIDHIKDRILSLPNCSLGYIYFSYHDQAQKTLEKVLRSLIQQLWRRSTSPNGEIPKALERLYDRFNGTPEEGPSISELEQALLDIKNEFTVVYFVFDALDEFDEGIERTHLLRLFSALGSGNGKVFITSRPHIQDIVCAAEAWNTIVIEAKQDDVRLFLNGTIEVNRGAGRMIRGELREFVVSSLVHDCKGMFLLAQLYIERLCQQITETQVRKAMIELKATVETGSKDALQECYDHAMDRIRRQSPSRVALAQKVLVWLVKTKLKPNIDELRAVLSVDDDMTTITEADMPEAGLLVEVCAGLVTIEHSSNSVQFAHHTVEEYLETKFIADMSLVSEMILVSSINYLRVTGSTCCDQMTFDILNNLDYYVVNCNQDRHTDIFIGLLESKLYGKWFLWSSEVYSPLVQACWWRHLPSVEYFLRKGESVYKTVGRGLTLLDYACLAADEKLVKLLIDGDADVKKDVPDDGTITKCTISDDMDVWAYDWAEYWAKGAQALGIAGQLGDRKKFEVLQRRGATFFSAKRYKMGRIHMMIRLPQVHVGPWSRTHPPLPNDYVNIVRALITSNDQLESKLRDLCKIFEVLKARSENDRVEVLKHDLPALLATLGTLIAEGEDIEEPDFAGRTALHVAVFEGVTAIVKALLQQGASVSATDYGRNTPLHLAVSAHCGRYPIVENLWREREEIVEVLLNAGSDVTTRNNLSLTPLHLAAAHGTNNIVDNLLSKGADVLSPTWRLETPLHFAATRETNDIVDTLLSKGADVHSRNHLGWTPLYKAIANKRIKLVETLLSRGADVLSRNKHGKTLLHIAISSNSKEIVEILLSNGADVLSQDMYGRTSLHTATSVGGIEIAEALLSKGADVLSLDRDGMTPLHTAASFGKIEIAEALLSRGADVLNQTRDGETALMIVRMKKDKLPKSNIGMHKTFCQMEDFLSRKEQEASAVEQIP